jgi:hypothetical protein
MVHQRGIEVDISEESIALSAEATDAAKVELDSMRFLLDQLNNAYFDVVKAQSKADKQKENLSDIDRKNQIANLKTLRDIQIERIKLTKDGIAEEIGIENVKYEAQKELIKLSLKDQNLKNNERELADAKHQNKMIAIKDKYAKLGIEMDSNYNLVSLRTTTVGYDNDVALAEEQNRRKLALIKHSQNDKETKDKLAEIQELNHQLALDDIVLKHQKIRLGVDRDIKVAQIEYDDGGSFKAKQKVLLANYEYELDLLDVSLANQKITLSEFHDQELILFLDYTSTKLNNEEVYQSKLAKLQSDGAILDLKLYFWLMSYLIRILT